MTRPTGARLDEIREMHADCLPTENCDVQPLFRELDALRRELQQKLSEAFTEGTLAANKAMGERIRALESACRELAAGEASARAILDCVKELPAKWRECEGEHCARCARELEHVLRDAAPDHVGGSHA